jgi:hypothetical protein
MLLFYFFYFLNIYLNLQIFVSCAFRKEERRTKRDLFTLTALEVCGVLPLSHPSYTLLPLFSLFPPQPQHHNTTTSHNAPRRHATRNTQHTPHNTHHTTPHTTQHTTHPRHTTPHNPHTYTPTHTTPHTQHHTRHDTQHTTHNTQHTTHTTHTT